MPVLQNKIDFAVVIRVKHANPNGDPLNGNRPRTDYNNYGEITDVCLKRKMRDRLQENGHAIYVQSDDSKVDGARSLRERAESDEWGLGKNAFMLKAANKKKMAKKTGTGSTSDAEVTDVGAGETKKNETIRKACEKWIDVRAFGNLFAWSDKSNGKQEDEENKKDNSSSVSIGIRGPVSIHSAFSVQPVEVTSTQITKSVNAEGDGTKRGSDTIGMKHRVDDGVYVFYGSMNPQLAERTNFSDADAEAVKQILPRLFENDASSARPEGSMEVLKVIWWKHNCKSGQCSSAKVHRSITVGPTGEIEVAALDGLEPEVVNGF
jgi:CRISPR-associated protein Csd2